jgi:hypothetical protein
LDQAIALAAETNVQQQIAQRVLSYQAWLDRRAPAWFDVSPSVLQIEGLRVRINPELGMSIDGSRYLVKLYFKQDSLSKSKKDAMLHLLAHGTSLTGAIPAILNVRLQKLVVAESPTPWVEAQLAQEAAMFVAMWHKV